MLLLQVVRPKPGAAMWNQQRDAAERHGHASQPGAVNGAGQTSHPLTNLYTLYMGRCPGCTSAAKDHTVANVCQQGVLKQ